MRVELKIQEVWSNNKWLPKSLDKTNTFKDFSFRYKLYIYITNNEKLNQDCKGFVVETKRKLKKGILILDTYVYRGVKSHYKNKESDDLYSLKDTTNKNNFEGIFPNYYKSYIIIFGFKIPIYDNVKMRFWEYDNSTTEKTI